MCTLYTKIYFIYFLNNVQYRYSSLLYFGPKIFVIAFMICLTLTCNYFDRRVIFIGC